ncbi:hypothetical protein ACIQUQ_33495 [Streptomyces sp. NPDC101118]|uniref:hypothetical protein n=1 Tax=Streptomyces sp. NPDC101118 TaxID=3366109 RepID=UPI00380B3279
MPRLEFPPGKDVLQLVWCALIHDQDEDEGPVHPRLYWRAEAEVLAAGHRMEHLLTITGDIQLGDCGGVCFFHCRRCPGLPWDWRYDCH